MGRFLSKFGLIVFNNGSYRDRQLIRVERIAQLHIPPAGIKTNYVMGWTDKITRGRRYRT